jgi:predicted dehydrogenase
LLDNLSVASDADLEADYQLTVHLDLKEALSIRPDVVFVCNPSSLHMPVALSAARAGAHLFIEKPVASDLGHLDELLSIVQAKRLVCLVGYNFRYHPGLVRLKELVDARAFGTILSVHAEIGEYLPNWHRYEDYRLMYAARKELGGGVILSQIHEMDLICWLFGLPKSIFCLGGQLSNLEVDVEDTASSLMQYDGACGRFPILLHQDFLQRPAVRTFKIVGDAGVGSMDLLANSLTTYDSQGEPSLELGFENFKRNDMFMQQMRHLLDCVESRAAPRVDLYSGIQSLRLALAAKESLAKGLVVNLPAVR